MWSAPVSLAMLRSPLLCTTGGSDTVRYIKKQTAYLILLSPPEKKEMSVTSLKLASVHCKGVISFEMYVCYICVWSGKSTDLLWPLIDLNSLEF